MPPALLSALNIIIGLLLLIAGGELLVRGASKLATAARISPLVIGLTVVAFGTSAPELAVSVRSAWSGSAELAVGNVVGSNIANVLLILGLSALISPLMVASQLIRVDVPLMFLASLSMFVLALDGSLGRIDSLLLLAALLLYLAWLLRQSRKESKAAQVEFAEQLTPIPERNSSAFAINAGMIILGLLLLGFGSQGLVKGAVSIAQLMGVKELIIGLTVVAVGTSLPEIVTSVMASLRGQRDIAVGNVVGSNLFNIFCVLGLTGVVAPDGISVSDAALYFDIPVMIAVSFACLPIFFTGNEIARWEGGLFFGYYLVYTIYLVLASSGAAITRTVGVIMLVFVMPLTILTLAVCVFRSFRSRNTESPTPQD